MNDLDPIEWFHGVYEKLRPITERKFVVRPHPNHVVHMEDRIKEFPEDVEVVIGQKYFNGDEKSITDSTFKKQSPIVMLLSRTIQLLG